MDTNSIPVFWQWVSVAMGLLGLAALLMAIPPFLWMVFGQPDIQVDFGERKTDKLHQLYIGVRNNPVTNPFLRRMWVRRFPAYVNALYGIKDKADGKVVLRADTALFGVTARELLPTLVTQELPIVEMARGGAATAITPDKQRVTLPPSTYEFTLILVEDNEISTQNREFVVGTSFDILQWTREQ